MLVEVCAKYIIINGERNMEKKNALLKTALDLMRQKVCVHFTI